MAKKKKAKESEAGTLDRLSKAGEDVITRLVEELSKNERITEAMARAMAAKGKLDDGAKRAVGQVGLAAADELKDLRKHVERLEKRLARLETDTKPKPAAKPRTTKPRTTATATRARKPAEPKPPPAAEPPASAES